MRGAAVLVLLLALGCSGRGEGKSPEGAVRLLMSAARGGDRAAAFQRLGPRTRARIEALQQSSKHSGGRLLTRPEDFLSVGSAPPIWEVAGMRTLRQDDTTAEVEVYSATGDRHTVALVREGQEWKVEVPGK